MMRKQTYLFALSMLFTCLVFSQNEITGTVVDAGNQPLPGAVIQIKDTNIATMTDFDGQYTIEAGPDNILVFSMMGMVSKQLQVGAKRSIDIQLKDDVAMLDEVVVVGYGSVAKKDLTGAVAIVKSADIEIAPVANFDQALSGRISGVTVTSSEGTPGSGLKIVVRGGNSLTSSNDPLYVVNGIPLEDFDPSTINTTDIESFQVLKDASATAIYGSRGANGVVVVTTKSGKTDGTTDVTVNFSTAVSQITKTLDVMSPFQFVKHLETQAVAKDGYQYSAYTPGGPTFRDKFIDKWVDPELYREIEGRDYQNEAFQMAIMNTGSFSIRGGNPTTNIFFSAGFTEQDGVLITTGFKKINSNFTIRHKINKKFDFRGSVNYTNSNRYGPSMRDGRQNATLRNIVTYKPVEPLVLEEGELEGGLIEGVNDQEFANLFDPIKNIRGTKREDKAHVVRINTSFTYKLNKYLTLKTSNGMNTTFGQEELFYSLDTQQGTRSDNGINGQINGEQKSTVSSSNTLTFKKKMKKFNLNALLGAEYVHNKIFTSRLWNKRLPSDEFGIDNLDIATLATIALTDSGENKLESYFGRVNLGYDNRFLFTATYRADGSSKFQGENTWGYFPSVSGAWQIGNEEFMSDVDFVNSLKLRVGYGVTGNNRIANYASYNQFVISNFNGYAFGSAEQYQPGAVQTVIALPNLRWESTEQLNAGLDFSVLSSRVSGTIDYYKKNTIDLLLNADLSPSSGFVRTTQNIGSVSNKGLEISLNSMLISNNDFTWNSNINISFNKNKVEALADGQKFIKSDAQVGFNEEFFYISELGQPVGMMYGFQYDGLYQAEDFIYQPPEPDENQDKYYDLKPGLPTYGNYVGPGSVKYIDQNGDGVIDQDDRVVIGNPHPKHFGGWNNTFRYKRFDLAILLQWSYGFDVLNANRSEWSYPTHNGSFNLLSEAANAWTPWNIESDVVSHYTNGYATYPRNGYKLDSRYIEDGSYIRLKTVSFGYNIPMGEYAGIEGIKLTLSGQNLYTLTNYSGFDPEASVNGNATVPNLDYSAYPQSRTYSVSVRLKF